MALPFRILLPEELPSSTRFYRVHHVLQTAAEQTGMTEEEVTDALLRGGYVSQEYLNNPRTSPHIQANLELRRFILEGDPETFLRLTTCDDLLCTTCPFREHRCASPAAKSRLAISERFDAEEEGIKLHCTYTLKEIREVIGL